nr:hypothetical protein [Tanacetum cinerariifolium]
RLVETAVLRCK